jgi:hypothetical protein
LLGSRCRDVRDTVREWLPGLRGEEITGVTVEREGTCRNVDVLRVRVGNVVGNELELEDAIGPASDTATREEAGVEGDENTLRGWDSWEGEEQTVSCGSVTTWVGLGSAATGTGAEGEASDGGTGGGGICCKPLEGVF